jgi:hypothetical protein
MTSNETICLKLWLHFLEQVVNGISLNLLTYHHPTRIGRSDASEHGIGGFLATTGIAWRWEIPLKLRWQATLNVGIPGRVHYSLDGDSCWEGS